MSTEAGPHPGAGTLPPAHTAPRRVSRRRRLAAVWRVGELARSAHGQVEAIGLSVGMPVAPHPTSSGSPGDPLHAGLLLRQRRAEQRTASAQRRHPRAAAPLAGRRAAGSDRPPRRGPPARGLRATTEYRTAYGATPEQDLLTLKPFAAYATPLRALGLTDAAALAATPTRSWPPSVSPRLSPGACASSRRPQPRSRPAWLPGGSRSPPSPRARGGALGLPRPDLVDPMKKSLETYSTVPDPADLRAFLAPPAG